MAQLQTASATLDDLLLEPGKAELIGGKIVPCMATGEEPSRVAFRIARNLADFAELRGAGQVHPDIIGYAVPMLRSGRESFSPDASFFSGPARHKSMRFIDGPPTFAVEVRSQGDYLPGAAMDMAHKRADYFEAGTVVVWDVDTLGERILAYKAADPQNPVSFQRGQIADAEPAVPGWRVSVDWIFG